MLHVFCSLLVPLQLGIVLMNVIGISQCACIALCTYTTATQIACVLLVCCMVIRGNIHSANTEARWMQCFAYHVMVVSAACTVSAAFRICSLSAVPGEFRFHRFLHVRQGNMQPLPFRVRFCAIVAHLQSKLEAFFHRWMLQPKTKPLQTYGEASKYAELLLR